MALASNPKTDCSVAVQEVVDAATVCALRRRCDVEKKDNDLLRADLKKQSDMIAWLDQQLKTSMLQHA